MVWETEVGRAVPLTKRHFKATQANSSPATDGEHVVVVFPTAGLACLGADGALCTGSASSAGLNAGGFNDPALQWGFAASPILHDGKVILQVDIHDGPYLAAWDLEDRRAAVEDGASRTSLRRGRRRRSGPLRTATSWW